MGVKYALTWIYLRYFPRNHPQIIPFRESKLTRLFQGFFCGKGKASMIVNINQCAATFDETYHALKFSAIAKQVYNTYADVSNNVSPLRYSIPISGVSGLISGCSMLVEFVVSLPWFVAFSWSPDFLPPQNLTHYKITIWSVSVLTLISPGKIVLKTSALGKLAKSLK